MKGKTGQVKRRQKALLRLEEQLVLGIKRPKKSTSITDLVKMSDKDIQRIKKEIGILKSRV